MQENSESDENGKKIKAPSADDVPRGDADDADDPQNAESITNSYYYDDSHGYEVYDPDADDDEIDPEL